MVKHTSKFMGNKDMVKRDRLGQSEAELFELLSAYLDGETTAAERRQIEELLATDDTVKSLYARQLKLRQGLRTLPIPAAAQNSPEAICQKVWQRLRFRSHIAWMCGGAAIAACAVTTLSGLLPGSQSPITQMAIQPAATSAPVAPQPAPAIPESPLMVAINNPVIEIPKTAVAIPKRVVNNSKNQNQAPGTEFN
jgi:anti-sigma factor RsiW